MTLQTIAAIKAILEADTTATKTEREAVKATLDGGTNKKPMPELWTRRQVADMIKKTPTMVDNYARQGFIKRVRLGNSTRAAGFDADSVRAFLGMGADCQGKGGAA